MSTATDSSPRKASPIPQRVTTMSQRDSPPLLPVRVVTDSGLSRRRPMTEREKQLIRLVCDGLTNKEMATHLGISRETVKSELKRIFRKIEVRNRTQAAVMLIKQEAMA